MERAPVASRAGKLQRWGLVGVLALVVFASYGASLRNDFVNYDDDVYVTDNPHLRQGLGPAGIAWAFGSTTASNWHPLTWLSHMMDYRCFGLRPWGHHLTSLLLHVLNTLLVFLGLRSLTGAPWRAFVVAAIFGLHPLHVQSVAWAAERKDVLCSLFFLLALGAYARFARSQGRRPRLNYAMSLLCFALGLLSKPMLVTLPAVLLLFDLWPLARWGAVPARKLIVEKLPFLALAATSSAVTFFVQRAGGGMASLVQLSLAARAQNVLLSYARYVGKLLWPVELAVLYPFGGRWSLGEVFGAGIMLVAISSAVTWWRRRCPYLFVGWLWFVGMLVPVIGLVQVGQQTMADRYMYLPMLGLLVAVVWGGGQLASNRAWLTRPLAVAGTLASLACGFVTHRELDHWRDSEALFRRALAVTGGSATIHYKLGLALFEKGKLDEAYRHFQRSLAIAPGSPQALAALGVVCNRRGEVAQAIRWLEEALAKNPADADWHYQLGTALDKRGRHDEAVAEYERALAINPTLVDAHLGIGVILARKGRLGEAMARFSRALAIDATSAPALYNLGLAHATRGEWEAAATAFRRSLALNPNSADAYNNLGLVLLSSGKRAEATRAFQAALRLAPNHARARRNLEEAWRRGE